MSHLPRRQSPTLPTVNRPRISPWSKIRLHHLSAIQGLSHQARLYSSSSSLESTKDSSPLTSDSPKDHAPPTEDESKSNEIRAFNSLEDSLPAADNHSVSGYLKDPPPTPIGDGHNLSSFQSLHALFQQPVGGRYSRPSPPAPECEMVQKPEEPTGFFKALWSPRAKPVERETESKRKENDEFFAPSPTQDSKVKPSGRYGGGFPGEPEGEEKTEGDGVVPVPFKALDVKPSGRYGGSVPGGRVSEITRQEGVKGFSPFPTPDLKHSGREDARTARTQKSDKKTGFESSGRHGLSAPALSFVDAEGKAFRRLSLLESERDRVLNPFAGEKDDGLKKGMAFEDDGGKLKWGLGRSETETLDGFADPGSTTFNYALQGEKASTQRTVEDEASSPRLTHVSPSGSARMVDVGDKPSSKRIAVARTTVRFSSAEPLHLIKENNNKKGDVLGVARIAGIIAAKRTSDLIPLCHPLALSKVELDISPTADNKNAVVIFAHVECVGPTGVEMEALTAASTAALTVYDMCKAVDRGMVIRNTQLIYKSGGRSGVWLRITGPEDKKFLVARALEVQTPRKGAKPAEEAGSSSSRDDGPRMKKHTLLHASGYERALSP